MSFGKMQSVTPPSDDKIIELETDQKVDSLLRSTEMEPAAEIDPIVHTALPEGDAITFFPKNLQQCPAVVPELTPSGESESIHPHSIGSKKLREMMSNWKKNHHETHSIRNEKQLNTIYVRITKDGGLQWYTLQNEADNVRLVLSHSDDPHSDSCEKSFSGSDSEKHFEEFCNKSKLIYVDINGDPKEISSEVRAEIGRKLQELINKRAVLDNLLRQNTQKTKGHLLDTVARWFGSERQVSLGEGKSTRGSSDIAEAREDVDIARRELAEQCRQINGELYGRSVVIPSRTKSFVTTDSSQKPLSSSNILSEKHEKANEDRRNILAVLLGEVAITQEELFLLNEKRNFLLEDLDFPEAMNGRFQKLREEAEKYFSEIDSMTLSDFFKELVSVRIQNRTSKSRAQSMSADQKSSEVFI